MESKDESNGGSNIFGRMFVCFCRPAYTFNTNCRNILEVNGLVIDISYKNVMIVVAALDGNDGILLIALVVVEKEDFTLGTFSLKI